MKSILLSSGASALVDDDDYQTVAQYKWNPRNGYAVTYINTYTDFCSVSMHGLIMGRRPNMDIDHINRNRLDNRRSNLRHCTRSENCLNSGPRSPASGFKGVYWNNRKSKWRVELTYKGKRIRVGHFSDREDAALAYNVVTQILNGPNMYLNPV